MRKICPTCSNAADIDAMFCSRCGVSIAHVEAQEAEIAAAPRTAARPLSTRTRPVASEPDDTLCAAEAAPQDQEPASAPASGGFARTIGAVAGAMLRGAVEGALSGGDCAHRGAGPFGEVFLTADGNQVFAGASRFSAPIYVIDGNELKEPTVFGKVLARLDGDQVRVGSSSWGDVIATIDGPEVYRGRTTWGQPVAHIQGGRAMLGVAAAYYLLRG